jgi:hypothetical protein
MTPFPASVAYRRFLQGVMVQSGRTAPLGYGTTIRLLVTTLLAGAGMVWGALDGATVGGLALGVAIVVEAVYTHWVSRSSVRAIKARRRSPDDDRLTLKALIRFYWPLAFTAIIWLWAPSLISLALANAARSLESLAVWPVVNGQISMFSSFSFSFLDVVVALLDGPASARSLRRFALAMGVSSLLTLFVVAFTPLAPWWLRQVAGLGEGLIDLAVSTFRLAALLPAMAVVLSWLRALVAKADATDAMARAATVNLTVLAALLAVGVIGTDFAGCHVAAVALTAARSAEGGWLWCSAAGFRRCLYASCHRFQGEVS